MQPMEYLVGVLCQCAGGIMWAFVIGVFSSLLSTANPSKIRFRQTMDDLNHMMDVRGPPGEDACAAPFGSGKGLRTRPIESVSDEHRRQNAKSTGV